MNCPQARERLPELLYDDLPSPAVAQLREHLASCPACRQEYAALDRVRQALDTVEPPAVAVDLPRLYARVAEQQQRRPRAWRRLALGMTGLAAALLVLVVVPRLEVRLEAQQLVVRWGPPVSPPVGPTPTPTVTVREGTPPPPPAPRAVPVVATSPQTSGADLNEQVRVLSDLVQVLAAEAEAREQRQRQDLARLRVQVQELQRTAARWRFATEKELAALYFAQFQRPEKGASP